MSLPHGRPPQHVERVEPPVEAEGELVDMVGL